MKGQKPTQGAALTTRQALQKQHMQPMHGRLLLLLVASWSGKLAGSNPA